MNNEIKIIDNFLPPNYFKDLCDVILSAQFPWHYTDSKVGYDKKSLQAELENKDIFQFNHMFYENFSWRSPYSDVLDPIIKTIKPLSILRIKANLTTISKEKIQYDYHRDIETLQEFKTAVYYINTNNGSTVFSSGEEVQSIANRIVIFNSTKLHTGTSCTDESRRVVINFNYIKES